MEIPNDLHKTEAAAQIEVNAVKATVESTSTKILTFLAVHHQQIVLCAVFVGTVLAAAFLVVAILTAK